MSGIKSEREPMSPADQAALERRMARAYAQGVGIKDLEKRFGLRQQVIIDIIKEKFPHIPIRGQLKNRRRAS